MMDDAAARKADREARRKARFEAELVKRAAEALLDTRDGRAFIWWLLQISGWGTQPFTANALSTSFACGRLDVGNQIVGYLGQLNPANFVRMQQERLENERDRNASGPDDDADGTDEPGESGDTDA